MGKLILASQSPRRQALLRQIGAADFTVVVPRTEERCSPELGPGEAVCAIAREKAAAAAALAGPEDTVIAADTVVVLDGRRLGKPRDAEEARQMLRALSGREHTVYTGVAVRRGGWERSEARATAVRFRALSAEEIDWYVATGEPMDKAGAYGIQERGALLVEGIRGDYCNVVGLPVTLLLELLRDFGVDLTGKEPAL